MTKIKVSQIAPGSMIEVKDEKAPVQVMEIRVAQAGYKILIKDGKNVHRTVYIADLVNVIDDSKDSWIAPFLPQPKPEPEAKEAEAAGKPKAKATAKTPSKRSAKAKKETSAKKEEEAVTA